MNGIDVPSHGKWALTQEAFDRFLAQLGADRESAGDKYVQVRRSLTRFFEWRGCPFPEDHTDEAINRAARRVSEGEEIRDPAAYVLGVARMLVLEIRKEQARERQALGEMANAPETSCEPEDPGPRAACLERCLGSLSESNRELILQYYRGDRGAKIANRKKLTERLQVSINTLRMRALRLREALQVCVENCVAT